MTTKTTPLEVYDTPKGQSLSTQVPLWQLKKIEELVKIFMEDYGASESLAREEAWKFKERLEKELANNEG